jgi:hypothetical protein
LPDRRGNESRLSTSAAVPGAMVVMRTS